MMRILAKFICGAVLLASPCTSGAQAQNLFFQPPTYAGGGMTVTADFNGDGIPDLASADGTVQLGNGDGTFKTGTPWNTGQSIFGATFIAVGDFNSDGKQDLVIPPSLTGPPTTLYVLLGNGDGTFQPAIPTNLGVIINSVVVADLNGDGKQDLLGFSSGGGGLFVFFGKGNGNFTSGPSNPSLTGGTLADFNGDGKLDLVVVSNPIQVHLGNGDGTFQAAVTSPGLTSPASVAIGDFNGDGKLDLALQDSVNQVVVLLGNGNGTFQAPGTPTSVGEGGYLSAADLNGDHKLDLVLAGGAGPFAQILLGNGDGTFVLKDSYLQRPGVAPAIVDDFNRDGKPDLAINNTILLGNGDGSFQGLIGSAVSTGTAYGSGVAGDFNRDGNTDIAIISTFDQVPQTQPIPPPAIEILLSDGAGGFSVAHTYTLPGLNGIATADLNGDGKLDLLVTAVDPNTMNLSIEALLGNGDGSFAAPVVSLQPTSGASTRLSLLIADLNNDHIADVVVLNGAVTVLLGKGDGTFGAPVSYFGGESPTSFLAADFNNDGIIDVAVTSTAGLGLLLGKGDGTFQPVTFPSAPVAPLTLEAVADLNGDGNADLIVNVNGSLPFAPVIQVLLGNGNGLFTSLPATQVYGGDEAFVLDVNGDGKLDLVQRMTFAPAQPGIQVLLGNDDGTLAPPITILNADNVSVDPTGNAPFINADALFVGNFNHDTRPDVTVVVSSTNRYQTETFGIVTMLNTSGPAPVSFLVSATAFSPAAVTPGESATATVILKPVAGFSGDVALSCTGLPAGAACNFAPTSVTGASGTSVLTITTTSSTPGGIYSIVVVGTSGAVSQQRALTFTVSAPATMLTPTSLTFPQQAAGTTSSPQSVQLTNSGTVSLAISTIAIAGTNAGEFAQTNNCGSSLATNASCQVNVTFTPTGMGTRTAAVSITDNAPGSPQMVTLTGTGPDFTMTGGTTTSDTIAAGQTATYTLSVAPGGGFNQSVMLTCSGAPAHASCAISPSTVALNGTSATTAMVSVTTMAASMSVPRPIVTGGRDYRPVSLQLLALAMLTVLLLWHRKSRSRWTPVLSFMILLGVAVAMTACGGGGSTTSPGSGGTPAGSYTITVTGTVASGSTTLTHNTKLTLVVQ